jgi:D-3-phosphoglycerate dehydrogenase
LTGVGNRIEPRIVSVDGHALELSPAKFMLVVNNDDRPGMIGVVGTALGAAEVSVDSMAVSPSAQAGTALMVLSTKEAIADEVLAGLSGSAGILSLHRIEI